MSFASGTETEKKKKKKKGFSAESAPTVKDRTRFLLGWLAPAVTDELSESTVAQLPSTTSDLLQRSPHMLEREKRITVFATVDEGHLPQPGSPGPASKLQQLIAHMRECGDDEAPPKRSVSPACAGIRN